MKYYVVADPHGFYTELKTALTEKGFFTDTEPHKLIVCGDLFDRGSEALALQAFVLDLMEKDEVILIRGNHEDLTMNLLRSWRIGGYMSSHHHANGTVNTVLQLTHADSDPKIKPLDIGERFRYTPFIQKIIPAMLDYFETPNYIFVHGWIPCSCMTLGASTKLYTAKENWRNADQKAWDNARWINGMEAAHSGAIEPGKTIVCGHWHTSFGHANYEGKGSEFGEDADFSPYDAEGIIALDTCTAVSRKVNCIVIED